MIRTLRVLPALALATACASTSGSSASPEGEGIVVQSTQNIIQTGGAGNLSVGTGMTNIVQASTARMLVNADKVFAVLPGAYESLGIPITTMVSKERMLGNLDFKVRARIGALPMRRLLDCGYQQSEPNADGYQIQMSVSSEVKDNGDGTSVLATVVQATGRPVQFSGADVRCTTVGELEKRIAAVVQQKLSEQR